MDLKYENVFKLQDAQAAETFVTRQTSMREDFRIFQQRFFSLIRLCVAICRTVRSQGSYSLSADSPSSPWRCIHVYVAKFVQLRLIV